MLFTHILGFHTTNKVFKRDIFHSKYPIRIIQILIGPIGRSSIL